VGGGVNKKARPEMSTTRDHGLRLSNSLINILSVALGLAAAYFMTIQSLKIELAAKAESGVVATLDKKLANFEVIVKQGVVSKEEFFRFSSEIEQRLTRIEYYLIDKSGENGGRKDEP
jgi:hypothetical protein